MRLLALFFALIPLSAYALNYEDARYCLGSANLRLQVADTPERREHGLMNRKKITPYDGMIFLFDEPRMIQMWMKNTPHPLDMLFVDAKGKLVHSVKNTVPYSEAIISSEQEVQTVIELEAGRADREGIKLGQTLRKGVCANAGADSRR